VLREEMAAMQTKMDEMTELMKTLTAAHNQPPPPFPISTQAEAIVSIVPGWMIPDSTPPTLSQKAVLGVCLFASVKYSALVLVKLKCLLIKMKLMFLCLL
jgi:hypothetical protein